MGEKPPLGCEHRDLTQVEAFFTITKEEVTGRPMMLTVAPADCISSSRFSPAGRLSGW